LEELPLKKDRSRTEREKLKGLSFSKKVGYIWEYYKYYIVGVIIATALILSISYTFLIRPDIGFFVTWSVSVLDKDEISSLTDVFDEFIFEDDSKETSAVSLFFANQDDPAFMLQYFHQIVAMLSVGSIDIFISSFETLQMHSVNEFLWPLDEILDTIKLHNPLIYEEIIKETTQTIFGLNEDDVIHKTTGIRITDTPLMRRLGFELRTDAYFSIAVSTQHPDRTAKALILFFE